MKPIDDVFQLAKSLTKNEKRFFKMYSQLTDGNKNYVRLFDVIEKEKEYNEQQIKKKLKGQKFISNLPYEKNYLYKQLLKALRIYHSESSIKTRARATCDFTEILMHKGFYDQALKQIRQNEKMLLPFDDINMQIMVSDQEEATYNRMGSNVNQDAWMKFFDKKTHLLARSLNMNEYRRLERELLTINAVSLMKPGKSGKALLTRIKNDPLLNKKKKLDSFDVRFRYFMINALLALYEYDYKKEAFYFREIMDLIDEAPEMKDAYYKEYYISTHFNLNVALLLSGDLKAAMASIDSFRSTIMTASKSQNAQGFFFLMNNETDLVMATGDLKRAQNILTDMTDGLAANDKLLTEIHRLYLLADKAVLLFLLGKHKESATTLTELTSNYAGTDHKDKNIFIRLLLIINYYELQKYDMIEYVLGSTERFLKKMDRVYKTEKIMLDLFRKLKANQKLSTSDLQQTKTKLELVMRGDKEEETSIFHFDFPAWIDSKIKNATFAGCIASKVQVP